MKIRSVLLGSVAIAGLTTAGYAADLGVVTSLDVCDSLSISGLTISSDDNCLQISGNISFEYDVGDYSDLNGDGARLYHGLPFNGKNVTVPDNGAVPDSSVDLDWWLKFVATADSDFGPATATLKLANNNLGSYDNGNGTNDIAIKEAWVGVGDTTKLMAGYKGSIFDKDDDTPLDYLGLFNSSAVNTGVQYPDGDNPFTPYDDSAYKNATGGMSIQVTSDLGNGLTIGGGLENLDSVHANPPSWTAVGVLKYAGDNTTAHISVDYDQYSYWNLHAGFTGTFDTVKVVGAIAAAQGPLLPLYWNALGSASVTLDMFTLAGSFEAANVGIGPTQWGVSGSIGSTISDGVKINLGGRYFTDGAGDYVAQVEAGVSAAVTEAITLSGAVGGYQSNNPTGFHEINNDYYGKVGVAWNPGGGFLSSATFEAHSDGGYKTVFKASKSIK